jgi:cystathionine beta-lyase/cystathionine gamma-synthase
MLKINTQLIHAGPDGDRFTGSVNVPIYQTSTYKQDSIGVMRDGWEYSRTGNPTRAALEAVIAELEEGAHGYAFASGMAAISAVFTLFKTGDKIILSDNVYGGTYRVIDQVFNAFDITYEMTDTNNEETLKKALADEHVAALYIESPANPLMTVTDIKKVAQIAHDLNKLVIVDNTFMTPYLQRPLTLGADIVIHSATKYLGGHSDVVAGAVLVNDDDLAKRLAFIQNSTGGVAGPFDSYLLLRGIKTLGVRMDRHVANAQKIAEFLAHDDRIKKVYYPGLKTDPGYEVQKKQADGAGAMISFELSDDYDYHVFFKSLKVASLAESLGGVESLVCHPSTMTHAAMPQEIRDRVGITEELIRYSVGIEDVDDLIADLDQAIDAAKK